MIKEFLKDHAAVLTVAGISLAISFMIAGIADDSWARMRGR